MKFLKFHLPFILYLILIFIESSIPAAEYPKIEIWGADKLVHLGVYGFLTALCCISLINQEKFPLNLNYALLFSFIFAALYGASDEFHQYFVPNRECEFWDWLADFGGAAIMVLLIKYYLSRKMKIFQPKKNNLPKKI